MRLRSIVAVAVATTGVASCGGAAAFTAQEPVGSARTEIADALSAVVTTAHSAAKRPRSMTLAQSAGQRIVFAYSGLRPPRALERRIRRGQAAGVILFARNVRSTAQVRRTVRRLQRIPRPRGLRQPLLVMVDQEGGPVRRIPGGPRRAAADAGSARRAAADGRSAARTLRAAGANVDLAPVVDLAEPGGAITRERRSYGRLTGEVSGRARAFAGELRRRGVSPVLKHFPGFGAATVNTDDAPARIDRPLRAIRRRELVPYRRIRAPAVMVASAVYPRVAPEPVAFSRLWITGVLRRELGFKGVVITDDLEAKAVRGFGSPAQRAYWTVKAGADIPLFAQNYSSGAQAAAGLMRAVRSGRLSRAQLDRGARRTLAWRATLPR